MKQTTILKGWTETVTSEDNGWTSTRFNPGGDPDQAAIIDAVLDKYPTPADLTDQLYALAEKKTKVTLLRSGANFIGGKIISAFEGTLLMNRDKLFVLPKGASKKGYYLDVDTIFDVRVGYNKISDLADTVNTVKAKLPAVQLLTQERLEQLPDDARDNEGNTGPCTLAVFGTWRMPDEEIPGAVWLIHSYMKDDDIAEGVLLVDGRAFSEHGSLYGRELLRMGGEIVNYQPISFATAIDLCNADYDDAVALVIGKVTV